MLRTVARFNSKGTQKQWFASDRRDSVSIRHMMILQTNKTVDIESGVTEEADGPRRIENKVFRSLKSIAFLAILISATALHGQDGWSNEALCFASGRTGGIFGPSLATADFDDDGHPDGVLLRRSRSDYQINVQFCSYPVRSLTFASDSSDLAISAIDANRDSRPDLVLENVFSRQRLFVWLNDGSGRFYAAAVGDYPADPQGDDPKASITLPRRENRAFIESSKALSRELDFLDCRDRYISHPLCARVCSSLAWTRPSPNGVRGSPVPFLSLSQRTDIIIEIGGF